MRETISAFVDIASLVWDYVSDKSAEETRRATEEAARWRKSILYRSDRYRSPSISHPEKFSQYPHKILNPSNLL